MHLTLDLPTGDLGPAKAIARVRIGTRLTDTVLHSLGPALFEEAYFRGCLFAAAGSMLPPRATVALTTLAFAARHPLELIPFAAAWGAAAGLARLRLGSFWPIVAAHAVWNGIAYADAWMLIG